MSELLKEDRVLRIRLQSHQVHCTVLTMIQQLCSMKQKHTVTEDITEMTGCCQVWSDLRGESGLGARRRTKQYVYDQRRFRGQGTYLL